MTTSTFNIPSFEELLQSLPNKFHTDAVKLALQAAFDREVTIISEEVANLGKQNKPFLATMNLFSYHEGDTQALACFEVRDLSRPVKPEFNWHCQNTSQWVYAGAILFDRREFENGSDWTISVHH